MSGLAAPQDPSVPSKRFDCTHPNCNRSFRRKEHLKRHAQSHDALPRYKCHICGYRYARSDVLKRHVANHGENHGDNHITRAATPEEQGDRLATNGIQLSLDSAPLVSYDKPEASEVRAGISDSNQYVIDVTDNGIAESSDADHEGNVARNVSPEMMRFVDIYFREIHDIWPILHKDSFNPNAAPRVLLIAMATVASYYEGSDHHEKLAPVLLSSVLSSILQVEIPLHSLQALLLAVVYYLAGASFERMLEKATHLNSVLISTCRSRAVFHRQHMVKAGVDSKGGSWIIQEESKRLAYYILKLDAYISIVSDYPPNMRYQELRLPLLRSIDLWYAVGKAEQDRLMWNEPSGREKVTFAEVVEEMLREEEHSPAMCRFSPSDYRFALYAIQNQVWTETHRPDYEVETDVQSRAKLQSWWLQRARLCINSVGKDDKAMDLATSVLWHLQSLRSDTPPGFFRNYNVHQVSSEELSREQNQWDRLPSHDWYQSSAFRNAVWHAAQLLSIITRKRYAPSAYGKSQIQNPIGLRGLFEGSIVICVYTYHNRLCPRCVDGSLSVDLDLFQIDDPRSNVLQIWIESGTGLVAMDKFHLCHCQFEPLVTFFQKHVWDDGKPRMAFDLCMHDLRKGHL